MITVYLISLVVGGILLVASLLGDVLGMDALHLDTDTDAGAAEGGDLHILTMRSATYFLFVFGATGAALSQFAGTNMLATLAVALLAGLLTAFTVTRVFGYLKATDSGGIESDSSLHGLAAEVIIPLGLRSAGKVSVRRGSERLELLARAFDEREGDPAAWRRVRIIDVRDGTALVVPAGPES